MEPLGLIGFLVFLAGVHLLWQAREECLFWAGEFLRIFRVSLRRSDSRTSELARQESPVTSHQSQVTDRSAGLRQPKTRARKTLRMVGGVGLVLLGQLLVILDLALRII
jgi:hypothetical protein